jgi:predicted nucleic acid-binding protein
VEVELHSAVALKLRTREFDAATASRVLGQFRIHRADGLYRLVGIQAREYALARDWIAGFSTPLRTLDALHLAAAFGNDMVLVTTDKTLASSARTLGVRSTLLARSR